MPVIDAIPQHMCMYADETRSDQISIDDVLKAISGDDLKAIEDDVLFSPEFVAMVKASPKYIDRTDKQ